MPTRWAKAARLNRHSSHPDHGGGIRRGAAWAHFTNVAIGLAAAPYLLGETVTVALVSNLVAGIALIFLSLPRGKLSQEH